MGHQFSKIMFSEAIKKLQERYGSRRQYERMAQLGPSNDKLTHDEVEFIQQRDSFYIASEGENGWPYIQHRGGPKGFLKVVDAKTLAFADFLGNKQFVTVGNVGFNNKVTLFLMDYPNRTRLKILGLAELVDIAEDPELAKSVMIPGYAAKVERVFKINVVGFDWNCPQHITPRFSEEELLQQFNQMSVEDNSPE